MSELASFRDFAVSGMLLPYFMWAAGSGNTAAWIFVAGLLAGSLTVRRTALMAASRFLLYIFVGITNTVLTDAVLDIWRLQSGSSASLMGGLVSHDLSGFSQGSVLLWWAAGLSVQPLRRLRTTEAYREWKVEAAEVLRKNLK